METDVVIVKNSNSFEQLVRDKRQCWENVQCSRRKCLPMSVKDDVLKRKYVAIFINLTLNVLKINNKKDFLQVLRVKKPLRYHDGTTFNLQSDTKTFFNENVCG